jgi:hypothetical protein
LDSIVTNLGPSKYTHRSPSKIWYIDLSSTKPQDHWTYDFYEPQQTIHVLQKEIIIITITIIFIF